MTNSRLYQQLEKEVSRIMGLLTVQDVLFFRARCVTAVWRHILLNDRDRPMKNGQLITLVGKNIGAGVIEITVKGVTA